jgi:hypothetical protein
MLDVNPYTATLSVNFCHFSQEKRALTLPPRPLQQPPTGFLQRAPVQSVQQGLMQTPVNGQPVQTQQGRGRPAGPSGTAQATPAQTGMPGQPSAVAQLGGSGSVGQSKGFGNTPTSATQTKSTAGGAAKSATYKGCGKMKVETTRKKTAPVSSAELGPAEKVALLGELAAGGVGSMVAPKGRGWEGFHRGVGRYGGLTTGGGLGGATGGLLGGGLGAGLGGLAAYLSGLSSSETANAGGLGAVAGGGLGGLAGGLTGAVKGYRRAGEYMGPSSYDEDNKKPDKGLKKEREEKKEKKSSVVSSLLGIAGAAQQGGSMESARNYSDRKDEEGRKGRYGHGLLRGLAGHGGSVIGGGIGAGLGALAGIGAGAGMGTLSDNPGVSYASTLAGGLTGGGLGLGLGGYYGGRLGLHLTKDKQDEETDMARADEEKRPAGEG